MGCLPSPPLFFLKEDSPVLQCRLDTLARWLADRGIPLLFFFSFDFWASIVSSLGPKAQQHRTQHQATSRRGPLSFCLKALWRRVDQSDMPKSRKRRRWCGQVPWLTKRLCSVHITYVPPPGAPSANFTVVAEAGLLFLSRTTAMALGRSEGEFDSSPPSPFPFFFSPLSSWLL